MFGLVAQLSVSPGARNDDRGGDTTQFAGDALCVDWLVLAFALGTVGTGSVHDSVVGARAAGYVDFLNVRMGGQISADFRPAVSELNVARLAKSRENLLKENPQIIVDRVHFEQAHLSLGI